MTYDSSGHTLLSMLFSSSLNYNNRDVTFTSSFFTLQSCQCQKPLVFVKEMLIKIALGFARSLIKLREELLVIFEGLIILLRTYTASLFSLYVFLKQLVAKTTADEKICGEENVRNIMIQVFPSPFSFVFSPLLFLLYRFIFPWMLLNLTCYRLLSQK